MTPPSQPPATRDRDTPAVARPAECEFRFHQELNDFLSPARRHRQFRHGFRGTPAVKDAIESLGVPHPEVAAIVMNGVSVGFSQKLRGGEHVEVYPRSVQPDVSPLRRLRPAAPRPPRFVADVHLGTLARYLRLLGFDTLYDRASQDDALVRQSVGERRILLSRDVGLLKRGIVVHAHYVRAIQPLAQLEEIVRGFNLAPRVRPFTRCMACNGRLRRVAAASVAAEVPPGVQRMMRRFARCQSCDRVYWPGTHFERLKDIISPFR